MFELHCVEFHNRVMLVSQQLRQQSEIQECIPVGCVPPAVIAAIIPPHPPRETFRTETLPRQRDFLEGTWDQAWDLEGICD